MSQPVLYTSIPPKLNRRSFNDDHGEAYLRECITSWHAAGFHVVSLNPQNEIENLQAKGLDVEFVANGTKGGRTKIGNFLDAMSTTGASIAGIINADCYLLDNRPLIRGMLDAASGSLVLLRRLDVDASTMRPTGIHCNGFDAFIFDTRIAAQLADGNDWSIGEPFWDYWFPISMLAAGARLKTTEAPALIHLCHEQQWRFDPSTASHAKMWRTLISLHSEQKLAAAVSRDVEKAGLHLQPEEVGTNALLDCFVPWLMAYPEQIPLTSSGEFIGRLLVGLEKSDEFNLKQTLDYVTLGHWLQAKLRRIGRAQKRIRSILCRLFSVPSKP